MPSSDDDVRERQPRGGPFDRRLVRELPVVRLALGASVTLGLVSTAAVVVQALALAHLLAGAMPGAHSGDRAAEFAWLGAAVALRALAAFVAEAVARLGATAAKADLRRQLLDAALASAPTGTGTAPGALATVAGRGLDALDVYLGRTVPDLVLAAAAPLALVVAVGALDWLSAVILLVAIALFPIFGALVGRASTSLAAERWHQLEALGRQVADVFAGLPALRALGRSAAQRERIARAGEALRSASQKTLRVAFLSALVLDTLASVSVALVAVPLGLRLLDGSISLSAALAVLILVPEVLLPLRRASAEFHESTEGLAAADAAFSSIGAARPERSTRAATACSGRAATACSGRAGRGGEVPDPALVPVALRELQVMFPGRAEPVLDDATLVISPGETVALVGANGVGKSTVASLLLGFSSPTKGSVTAGGADLRDLDLRQWRRKLAYLPERPTLVRGTLADNLRLAAPSASDADLHAALAKVGARRLVARLPLGLSTRLGEGGRPTSAGERQRVALARVMLRPASLYVLDEPTVHLDREGEEAVLEALHGVLEGRSALVITHRPAVLAIADRVVVLRGGGFVPVLQQSHDPRRTSRRMPHTKPVGDARPPGGGVLPCAPVPA